MCKVKSGNLIKNENDVQNLVIGLINRQQKDYKKEDIYKLVEFYFQGAELKMSNCILHGIVDDNLSFLYRKGLIDCKYGKYCPHNIMTKEYTENSLSFVKNQNYMKISKYVL